MIRHRAMRGNAMPRAARPPRACLLVCNSSEAGARVRREADVIGAVMPTVVLAMPGVLSTLVARVDGTRQLLGYPINALRAVTRRTAGRYDVVMVPRPDRVKAENRPPPPPGAPLPAWKTLYELLAGTIRLAILASHEK